MGKEKEQDGGEGRRRPEMERGRLMREIIDLFVA